MILNAIKFDLSQFSFRYIGSLKIPKIYHKITQLQQLIIYAREICIKLCFYLVYAYKNTKIYDNLAENWQFTFISSGQHQKKENLSQNHLVIAIIHLLFLIFLSNHVMPDFKWATNQEIRDAICPLCYNAFSRNDILFFCTNITLQQLKFKYDIQLYQEQILFETLQEALIFCEFLRDVYYLLQNNLQVVTNNDLDCDFEMDISDREGIG
eukprot:TRINITY_DN633_c1_g1_i3.p2 TRINITY_DN633_c1_g1~~TRINITY_DN633_c1_g1_i3.p2  ORF type:complete len:210 (-),score=-8.69 TRINITY_DN633_c1_g1_i3:138-767(-)